MASENHALASAGARIALATSEHPRHPSETMLDGNTKTFWVSTGMFPQEFVVSFAYPVAISKLIISSTKVAHWTIETSISDRPTNFEQLSDQGVEDADSSATSGSSTATGALQTHAVTPSSAVLARHVRFEITRGYAPFVTVHRIVVYGEKRGSDDIVGRMVPKGMKSSRNDVANERNARTDSNSNNVPDADAASPNNDQPIDSTERELSPE